MLTIPVQTSGTTASTIKLSNVKLTVDRTIPEGEVKLSIGGSAVDMVNLGAPFAAAVQVAAATCVTPAPPESKPSGGVIFKISDKKYTVAGVEKVMDTAPYIKDGRTYIPVRYAADACGVAAENILYADGKVTLIKGDKVVQLTIGSNVMVINGVSITMDVAAEISNDRTMLPFRWVAQALGAKVTWNEATQTVTMEL